MAADTVTQNYCNLDISNQSPDFVLWHGLVCWSRFSGRLPSFYTPPTIGDYMFSTIVIQWYNANVGMPKAWNTKEVD